MEGNCQGCGAYCDQLETWATGFCCKCRAPQPSVSPTDFRIPTTATGANDHDDHVPS